MGVSTGGVSGPNAAIELGDVDLPDAARHRRLQHVVEAVDIDRVRVLPVGLRQRRQDGSQVVDGFYVVVAYRCLYVGPVGDIEGDMRSTVADIVRQRRPMHGGDDMLIAVPLPQRRDQLGADLPRGSRDQYVLLHRSGGTPNGFIGGAIVSSTGGGYQHRYNGRTVRLRLGVPRRSPE